MNDADIELLTIEYIEEVVEAGGANYMSSNDLATFISELVLGNVDESERQALRAKALETAQMLLLPESCRPGVQVDGETLGKLKEALGG